MTGSAAEAVSAGQILARRAEIQQVVLPEMSQRQKTNKRGGRRWHELVKGV